MPGLPNPAVGDELPPITKTPGRLDLVKYAAGRIGSRAPGFVEQADLTSVGIFGLIDAVERFDPARGVRFESYALTRIKGSFDKLFAFLGSAS